MLSPLLSVLRGIALSGVLLGAGLPASAQLAVRLAEPQMPSPPPPLPPSPDLPPERVPPQTPVADLLPGDGAPAGLASAAVESAAAQRAAPRSTEPSHLLYPLPEPAGEVDPYGWRWSDSRHAWRMHAGHDLIAPEGTPVLAMAPGRVVLVEEIDGYGLTVLLDHGGGWQSLYAHLLDSPLREGELLRAGDRIGRVGRSGRATTDHLHVEVRRRLPADPTGATTVVAVDPAPLLAEALRGLPLQQAQGVSLASP